MQYRVDSNCLQEYRYKYKLKYRRPTFVIAAN